MSKLLSLLVISLFILSVNSYAQNSEMNLLQNGMKLAQSGKYDEAIIEINKAIELNPQSSGAKVLLGQIYSARGIVYSQKKEFDKSLEDFNKSIELDDKVAGTYVNRGIMFQNMGEVDKAIEDFAKAKELDFRLGSEYLGAAYFSRAGYFLSKADYDKAWEYVHKAQDVNYPIAPDSNFIRDLKRASGREK